jgi:hypothetical protein
VEPVPVEPVPVEPVPVEPVPVEPVPVEPVPVEPVPVEPVPVEPVPVVVEAPELLVMLAAVAGVVVLPPQPARTADSALMTNRTIGREQISLKVSYIEDSPCKAIRPAFT